MSERRRAFVLSPDEHYWSGFIIDLDVQDALPLFKKAHITRFGKDHETVHEAWEEYRTIVTHNEKDYVHEIPAHSKRDSGRICQDCWGLLVVPGDPTTRKRVISKVRNGIKFGRSVIPWPAIGYANLCISLRSDGSIGIKRFTRCIRCERDAPIKAEWYQALPLIGRIRF